VTFDPSYPTELGDGSLPRFQVFNSGHYGELSIRWYDYISIELDHMVAKHLQETVFSAPRASNFPLKVEIVLEIKRYLSKLVVTAHLFRYPALLPTERLLTPVHSPGKWILAPLIPAEGPMPCTDSPSSFVDTSLQSTLRKHTAVGWRNSGIWRWICRWFHPKR